MSNPEKRPKNREVENEMICPPAEEGNPPRPVTEPIKPNERHSSRKKKDKA